MEIDKEMLDKISNMSDEEISAAVGTVADILGANGSIAKRIAADPAMVRRRVRRVSPRDIRKIQSAISESDLAEIASALGLDGEGANGK